MNWDAVAIVVSLFSLWISYRTDRKARNLEKEKNKPIFYIRSTMEDRLNKNIEIELITLRYKDIRNITFKWIGDTGVQINYKKKLKSEDDNEWDYTILLDIKNTDKDKDIKGKIVLECSTIYEKNMCFWKDINICSKYYPLVEEYSQELKEISSTEFEEI